MQAQALNGRGSCSSNPAPARTRSRRADARKLHALAAAAVSLQEATQPSLQPATLVHALGCSRRPCQPQAHRRLLALRATRGRSEPDNDDLLDDGQEDEELDGDALELLQLNEFDEGDDDGDEGEYDVEGVIKDADDGDDNEAVGDDDDDDDDEGDQVDDGDDEVAGPSQGRLPLPYEIEPLTFEQAMEQVKARRAESMPELRIVPADELAAIEAAAAPVTAVTKPEGAQLTLNRQGYQAFQMVDVELLVAETADGRLDLSDAFVFDAGAEIYAPPQVSGKLPRGPVRLQVIPWVQRRTPDVLKQKEGTAVMQKVYFIGVESTAPYRLALQNVFCFDATSRQLSREAVYVAPGVRDPVLRIRADGISVEDTGAIPPPHDIAMRFEESLTVEEKEARLRERIEEMEARAEEVDELDEAPDVSAADVL